nr:MAG TPA: hypothetical protein [Caudoviricetes sp.]
MNILRNNTYKNMECIEIIISVNLFYAKQGGRYKSMPRLRKCCICGAEFLSHNGNTCCSDKCRIERKREQDKRGNYRRYHRLSGIPEIKICPVCGNTFYTIRNVYCSDECARIGRKKNMQENFTEYYGRNREEFIKRVTEYAKRKRLESKKRWLVPLKSVLL